MGNNSYNKVTAAAATSSWTNHKKVLHTFVDVGVTLNIDEGKLTVFFFFFFQITTKPQTVAVLRPNI